MTRIQPHRPWPHSNVPVVAAGTPFVSCNLRSEPVDTSSDSRGREAMNFDQPEHSSCFMEARRNTIGDALARAARRYSDRPALAYMGRHWSFSALVLAAD